MTAAAAAVDDDVCVVVRRAHISMAKKRITLGSNLLFGKA